jgi:Cu(I)/Ag(I) efflux system membrane protein CusA/SilA
VESVFGTVGRSESATDNAPLDMFDTTIMLKPREQWRPGMTYEKLIEEMDARVQFPGISNTWTSPVEGRLDMELTGIKTPLGIKVQGPNIDGIERLAEQIQSVLTTMPQQLSIFAERISQGFYMNVEMNREEAARYGLSLADVQSAVSSGIGGRNVAENIEGRERYPINVRYEQDFRDSVDRMRAVLIGTPSGSQIPLGQVARVSFSNGPAMIRDEDGKLTSYIYINLKDTNYGVFVDAANRMLHDKISLPANYSFTWSGEYQFEQRAKQRLKLIVPLVFALIFLLLYMLFHSVVEVVVLIVPTLYAMTGGLLMQWLLGYNFSVAAWVGYIALFGIAIETGVVMVVYLHEALARHLKTGNNHSAADIEIAVIEGAVQRLRPKLMTVFAVLASLIPILWASGVGSDVMKPIAAPIVGGMITSTIHVLILVPVFFIMMKERALRTGKLHEKSEIAEENQEL